MSGWKAQSLRQHYLGQVQRVFRIPPRNSQPFSREKRLWLAPLLFRDDGSKPGKCQECEKRNWLSWLDSFHLNGDSQAGLNNAFCCSFGDSVILELTEEIIRPEFNCKL